MSFLEMAETGGYMLGDDLRVLFGYVKSEKPIGHSHGNAEYLAGYMGLQKSGLMSEIWQLSVVI